jgi:hypothetical protein
VRINFIPLCGMACHFFVRFLHENREQLKVYNALRKGLSQFSKDFSEFQEEPEEIEGFAKLVSFAFFYWKDRV